MTRQDLEKLQVWMYLVAILGGLLVGARSPASDAVFEALLWPVLGCLLYATFTQVPLSRLPEAFQDVRFMAAVLFGNFLVIPGFVWALGQLLPSDPAIRLGVFLVLLVPCTDWFITFTQLGCGDTKRAIAVTPINLLLQIALLPVYLRILMGPGFGLVLGTVDLRNAFFGLILLPLVLAFLTQRWLDDKRNSATWLDRLGWLQVPLLAAVVFLIAASQVGVVMESLPVLGQVLLVFVLFLTAAVLFARIIAWLFALGRLQGRALAFSFGTRNSFVVLPFALALPQPWEAAVVVIVFQSLVELFGMVVYLWWVPTWLFPGTAANVAKKA